MIRVENNYSISRLCASTSMFLTMSGSLRRRALMNQLDTWSALLVEIPDKVQVLKTSPQNKFNNLLMSRPVRRMKSCFSSSDG